MLLYINTGIGQCENKCYTTKHFKRDTTIFISDTVLNIEKKWEYENVSLSSNVFSIDINHDDKAELVIAKAPENGSSFSNKLLIINSNTGRVEKEVVTPFFHSGRNGQLGPYILYDIDNDCIPEIIIAAADDIVNTDDIRKRLVCLDLYGNILWISNEKYGKNLKASNIFDGFAFVLADFNMDGISELVLLNEIFNIRTGIRLCHGEDNGMGLGGSIIEYSSSPVAANLDEDEYIELAAGYTVYKVRINNLEGEDGNTMLPINFSINGDLIDGSTAVSDINGDGRLDIIVNIGKRIKNRNGNVEYGQYIYTIQQDTAKLLSIAMNDLGKDFVPRYGNIACIGRLSEEDSLSIVVSFWMQDLRIYRYNGTDELELTSKILFVPKYGNNVADPYITMYDLDGDGEKEIIAQNQKNLMILKVVKGKLVVINRTACEKSLFIRNLIIISTDSTKQARICTTCYDEANDRNYLTIFGPPEGKHWAPARNIWHQYGYNPLFINDDGTVPQHMNNPATYKNGRYNNFNVQESLLDEDGNYPVPAASLYGDITCIGYDVDTDRYNVSFTVRNRADASATAKSNVPVAFFTGDPERDGRLIGVYHTTASITAGDDTGMLSYSFPASDITSLWMVVNTDRYPMILSDSSYYSIDECDYTDNVFIAELPKIQRQQQEICEGDTVDFYGQQLSTAGQYHYKLRSATDCDSLIAILDLTVTDKKDEAVTDIACDSYTWNGQTYDRSGDYEYRTTSISGCDSIVTLSLSIHPSIQQTETQTTCDSYEWNGQTYTTSGTFTYNGLTNQGCDSTITLNLTIHSKAESIQQISVCDSYEWNGQRYDQSGTYTYNGQTKQGCDSTAILELVISTSLTVTEEKTACDQIIINGITLDTSGDYPESYLTSTGCDSTHILRLTIHQSTQSNQAINACEEYDFFGSTITESGIYRHTLTNQQGCDSLITLDLRIAAEASQATATACGSYHW
ncbi:MAG: hypothetical protein LC107_02530, partial [Chitinophagales bacterium]|nr:hypothetical protein [Chitinophagales bacterium]